MIEMERPEDFTCFFTLFIPAYNRAYTIDKTFKSIGESTFTDFEVLFLDDGSKDNTEDLVKKWSKSAPCQVRYIYQENQGKAAAHNKAIEHANGFLFITIDAGDSLLPNALSEIKNKWEAIPATHRSNFAGVCGICLKDDGSVSGALFSEDLIDSDFNEIYSRSVMKNEKRWAIRLRVLREFPYPSFKGEKHVRPTLILRRMAHKYKLRFVNIPLQIERSEADGIRKNAFKYEIYNPKGHRMYFLEEINLNDRYHTRKKRFRLHVHYIRFSLHAKISLAEQASEVKHRATWLRALPWGIKNWWRDLLRIRKEGLSPSCHNTHSEPRIEG